MTKAEQPAFPSQHQVVGESGMSLLEYFAAHAPPVPDWYEPDKGQVNRFFRWRWYYASTMTTQARESDR